MELTVKIKKVLPEERRQYTNKNGEISEFISRGIILWNGLEDIYAEVYGEQALTVPANLDLDIWRRARLHFTTRTYTDRDGHERYIMSAELRGLTGSNYR